MLIGIKISIDSFLKENIENSQNIQIFLKGYSDGAPINSYIPYKGEFGNFPTMYNNENSLTSYFLNEKPTPLQIKKGDSIDNSKLSFLRAYSIKEFTNNYIPLLQKAELKYGFYGYTEQDKNAVGGKYRKVSITLEIIKPSDIPPVQVPEKSIKLLDWLLAILSAIFSTFLISQLNYHYKHWQDRKREKLSYKQDRNAFWVFVLLICIFLTFAILWVKPYLI